MGEAVCCNFVRDVSVGFEPFDDEPVLDSLFEQYGRVIVQSMITSFGLDFLVADRHGGDVDTIHNVRQVGIDSEMTYKNSDNLRAYENRGAYDNNEYHGYSNSSGEKTNYARIKGDARKEYFNNGISVKDSYVPDNELLFLGRSKGADPKKNAELDHIVEAKAIHEDRGRCLSGLCGRELADAEENFTWTNKSLNASMGSWAKEEAKRIKKETGYEAQLSQVDMKAYVAAHPELDEQTKRRMLQKYNEARRAYDAKISRAYYTSRQFRVDTCKAAGQVGARMGLRQALGLVFTELWFAVQDEFEHLKASNSFNLENFLQAVGNGVKAGLSNAKVKYKELFSKFLGGSIAGVLSSLMTTLCNIFFTTARNVVRVIRQSWASITEAAKILFVNPDNYLLGERLRAVVKVLATGASVVAGTLVAEALGNVGLKALPAGLGEIVTSFCGAFVSGILSCTFLYYLDRSETINKLVRWLDNLPSVEKDLLYYKRQVEIFERYAAQLMEIDLEQFKRETAAFNELAGQLTAATSSQQLNQLLLQGMRKAGITMPWEKTHGSFDGFMQDNSAVLRFS